MRERADSLRTASLVAVSDARVTATTDTGETATDADAPTAVDGGQIPSVDRGYAASGSVITFTRYGIPEAIARSIAGPI